MKKQALLAKVSSKLKAAGLKAPFKISGIKTASEWRKVQENNGNINKQIEKYKVGIRYLDEYIANPEAWYGYDKSGDEEDPSVEEAQTDKQTLEAVINVIKEGYLDSGYVYDDDDPRNQRDNVETVDDPQRHGTDEEGEMRAEISRKVAQNRGELAMQTLRRYPGFSDQLEEAMYGMNMDEEY